MRTGLEVAGVEKRFGGVTALRGVNTTFRPGRVHALLGENGAGKSTLVGVCSGAVIADSGSLTLDGHAVRFTTPHDAARAGIAVVHQEPALAPQLTVLENIFLPRLSQRRLLSRFRLQDLEVDAEQLLALLGVTLDLRARVERLPIAGRQLVELAKAVAMDPRVLILDEPNSALSPAETDKMLHLIALLRDQGRAMVLVSHRLTEVFAIGDETTVLRDGAVVWTGNLSETTSTELIAHMAGAPPDRTPSTATLPSGTTRNRAGADAQPAETVLSTGGLTRDNEFYDVDLTLLRGEILGLSGLVGAGRSELVRCLFGVTTPSSGEIRLQGLPTTYTSVQEAMDAGIALVPEDRRVQSLFAQMNVRWNIDVARASLGKKAKDEAKRLVSSFRIKTDGLDVGIMTLSGGNQQKAILARWVSLKPKVLILDEPTRGVDVNAKREIYDLIRGFANQGMSVILVSSELEEILELSDRILVMRHGRIVGEFEADPDPAVVMAAAFGEGASA